MIFGKRGEDFFLSEAGFLGVFEKQRGGGQALVDVAEFLEAGFGCGDALLDALKASFSGVGLRELGFGASLE